MSCTASFRHSGAIAIIDLHGRFTLADGAAGVIRNAVQRLANDGHRQILINLGGVSHIDSAAGLGELIGSYTMLSKMGGQLKLVNAQPTITHVLHITRLDTVFQVFPEESEALASFGKPAVAPQP